MSEQSGRGPLWSQSNVGGAHFGFAEVDEKLVHLLRINTQLWGSFFPASAYLFADVKQILLSICVLVRPMPPSSNFDGGWQWHFV